MRYLNDSACQSGRHSATKTNSFNAKQMFPIVRAPAMLFACVALTLASYQAMAGEQAGAHEHSTHQHGNVFPPQRSNISNVVWLKPEGSGNLESGASDAALAASRSAVEVDRISNDPQLKQALGERFVVIGSTLQSPKKSAAKATRHAFFSHSKNATVEVTMAGSAIDRIDSIAPGEYQPPLAAAEVDAAIALARSALLSARYTATRNIPGYAILAYPPNSSRPFYANRMAYVSFHVHEDAQPEYTALVDLTEQRVLSLKEG